MREIPATKKWGELACCRLNGPTQQRHLRNENVNYEIGHNKYLVVHKYEMAKHINNRAIIYNTYSAIDVVVLLFFY